MKGGTMENPLKDPQFCQILENIRQEARNLGQSVRKLEQQHPVIKGELLEFKHIAANIEAGVSDIESHLSRPD
jgi:hypothetical protein